MSIGRIIPLLALALGMAACGTADKDRPQRPAASADVSTPVRLLQWIADHPANAGIAVVPDHGKPLGLNATRSFPLASVRKVLIAGALVDDGGLRGTLGSQVLRRFTVPGSGENLPVKSGAVPLRTAAQAMIEQSDNNAADALLAHIGPAAVDAWARAHGMRAEDPIYPLLGEFAAWQRDPGWTTRTPAARARRAIALAHRIDAAKVQPPPVARQQTLAEASVAGTPGEWARLMSRIAHRGDPELQRLLSWPLRKTPKLRQTVSRFLAKGGNLAGVVTEVDYLKPRQGSGAAVALLLRNLPPAVSASLGRTFMQQKLVARLALDPAFRERARRTLEG